MNSPFNALMDPAQIGAGITNAFRQGREAREQAEKMNALSAYAQNQSPETAGGVARHDPMLGIQLQDREAAKAKAAEQEEAIRQERLLIGSALNGDPNARAQLAYMNADWYLKLEDAGKKQVDQVMEAIAQQAFQILQQPENQHGALLQQALAGLQAQGIDTSQFSLSGNPTQDLKTALAMAGKLEAWERFAQPSYEAIGEAGLAGFQFGQPIQQGGQVQNFAPGQAPPPPQRTAGDALTFAEFQSLVQQLGPEGAARSVAKNGIPIRVASPQEAQQLPRGARYIAPDGTVREIR